MNRAHKLAVLVGAALAVWVTVALRGQFLHKFVVVSSLTATVLLFLAWFFLRALRNKAPKVAAVRHACSFVGIVLLVISVSYVFGALIHYRDVRGAQQFCEQIAAAADAWRDKHGSYPESQEELADGLQAPLLLQGAEEVYVSDSDAYVLSFSDQAGLLDTAMIYTSQDREWRRVPLDD